MAEGPSRKEARRRVEQLAPISATYYREVEHVLTRYLTIGVRPNLATATMTTDSRGYRLSRNGEASVASDDAPDDAGFVLGGSSTFGFCARDDWGTLPSAMWRRSGKPYVNLGVPGNDSVQELITALPFVERAATFIVCSGANVFTVARAPALDPLFGPSFLDFFLRRLETVTVEEIVDLVKAARNKRKLRPHWAADWAPREMKKLEKLETDATKVVASAASRQLRDLRALRRLVPDEAEVIFVLQPVAHATGKELSDEEVAIFEVLDPLRASGKGVTLKELEEHWSAYARELARGCAELGVPFIDLSEATYTGWCFVNALHLTEHGYDIAAAFLLEAMA